MAGIKDNLALQDWQQYLDNISHATPIDLKEDNAEKLKRIKRLENNHEEWFRYYFPNFYTSEPARFHIMATKRVMMNPEWYEVRPWSRELSKSSRTMMESLKLILTKKKRNLIMVSNSADDAERLLAPYRAILEANNRIINDYGQQKGRRKWGEKEFITKGGAAFRAIGAGQSPRGTRNDNFRPDIILIDDIDTDEEVRNPERIKNKVKWVEEALIPTRSVSNDLTIIVCGNIIGKFTTVTELMKKADYAKVVNIRDKNGKSTWPQKNSEKDIDRVLSLISSASAQKEYFNNPQSSGEVFSEINYGTCPPIRYCEHVVVYADPATSNKDKGSGSTKSVILLGFKAMKYYVYELWVDHVSNATFISWLFAAHDILHDKNVPIKRFYIENNSLQDPFYQQVLLPLIYKENEARGYHLPITPDERKKPEKFNRIEGTLEPLHRLGALVFDQKLKGQTHMQRFEEQWLAVSTTCKMMDGPDCLEGGVWIIQNRQISKSTLWVAAESNNRKY